MSGVFAIFGLFSITTEETTEQVENRVEIVREKK